MPKFISRPVEIEAVQCLKGDWQAFVNFIGDAYRGVNRPLSKPPTPLQVVMWCEKSNACVNLQWGDWAIRESDGVGFYPCVAEVFAARYTPKPDGMIYGPMPKGCGI